MNRYVLQLAICLALLTGCNQGHEITADQAHSIADGAIDEYCDRSAEDDCQNLTFTGASHSKEGWLVEYRSASYLHAVLVRNDGGTEISRFKED